MPSTPLPTDRRAEEAYVAQYLRAFPSDCLRRLRVVVWEHSAVGRELVARILRELGAETHSVGRSETFVPIDTENVTRADLEALEALTDGLAFDAIVSTDGDSDRPFVVAPSAAARQNGTSLRFLPGDLLGAVVAGVVKPDAVAIPISANDAIGRVLSGQGVEVVTTRVGSPYVIAALDELASRGFRRVVGWEANGGFLVESALDMGRGSLEPLPTRDALLPILANLFTMRSEGVPLRAIWDGFGCLRGSVSQVSSTVWRPKRAAPFFRGSYLPALRSRPCSVRTTPPRGRTRAICSRPSSRKRAVSRRPFG